MKLYEARKSVCSVITFWRILACILIIPLIVLIFRIIAAKKEVITFYEDKIVYEKGWLNKSKKNFAFTGVFSVDTNQPLFGRLFN